MLKLLRLEEFCLKKRSFDINIVLDFVKLLLLKVKRCFLFQHFFSLNLQLFACLLNLDRQRLKLNLFLLQIDKVLLELLPISIDKLSLFLEQSLLTTQLMLVIREQFLTIFYLDLLDLDLSDVVLALLGLKLFLFLLEKLACVFNLTLLVLKLHFDEAILRATFLVFLLEALSCDRETFLGLALFQAKSLLILLKVSHHLLPLLS